jgi:hypothetical protein
MRAAKRTVLAVGQHDASVTLRLNETKLVPADAREVRTRSIADIGARAQMASCGCASCSSRRSLRSRLRNSVQRWTR